MCEDLRKASKDYAISLQNVVGSFNIARETAFIDGANWQKGRTVPAIADANPDAAVMRMLGSIENRLMEMQGRVQGVSMQASENWKNATACILDVGQKVEAVLTQAVSNGELIEAVHGHVAGGPDCDPEATVDLPYGCVHIGIDTASGTDEAGYSIGIDGKLYPVEPEVYYEWVGLKNIEQDFEDMKEAIVRKHLRS